MLVVFFILVIIQIPFSVTLILTRRHILVTSHSCKPFAAAQRTSFEKFSGPVLAKTRLRRYNGAREQSVSLSTVDTIALVGVRFFCSCQTPPKESASASARASSEETTPAQKRFKDALEDRLGPIWYQLVGAHEDYLSLGTVKTRFDISAAGGKPQNVRVISDAGGRIAELVALRAIGQLRAPAIPPQVLAELHSDHMEFEESFTIFASR